MDYSDSDTPSSKDKSWSVLPERQAKVNQLLRAIEYVETGDGGSEVARYCICRSTDCTSFMIGCDNCNEWYHGACIGITPEESGKIKRFYCDLCKSKNSSLEIKYKKKKEKKINIVRSDSSDTERSKYKDKMRSTHNYKKSTRRCGECSACQRTSDCGRCDFCKDMRKFGGENKIRQKCRLRQCSNFGLLLTGDKMDKLKKSRIDSSYHDDSGDDENAVSPVRKKRGRKPSTTESPKKKKERKKEEKEKRHYKKSEKSKEGKSTPKSMRRKYPDFDIEVQQEEETVKQCHGPGCIKQARLRSKYCSDECGMSLAKRRIFELLPPKIRQWQSSPCMAEEFNKRALEEIRKQQADSRQKLGELDDRSRKLETLIERSKRTEPRQDDEETTDGEEDSDLTIYCVTCGGETQQKHALKHMEKCFIKFEAQTSFGSIYKTKIEGYSIFCDFYNPTQKTYCKRLKLLCPEHSKEPRIPAEEVCGCPLLQNVFEEKGEFCNIRRRKCNKHHCWEKLRRAQIDTERVRQWMKLDDLFEQERNIRIAMSNRMGLLGLLLHQTIDHDPLNPIRPNLKVT